MAHTEQLRPESVLGFQVKVLQTFDFDPYSLGSGLNSKRNPLGGSS